MKNDLFEQQNVVNPGGVYDYFGIYHKKFLYYLSNNVDASVIRHEIDKGSKSHIEVPGSKIPNSHYSGIIFQNCLFVIILIQSTLAIINYRNFTRSEARQLFLDFRRI